MTTVAGWRRPALLFLGAILVRSVTAALVSHPGYMDAYYYFHVGRELALGHGLTERVVWNHLASPAALPRPAGAYWPPGTSLLAVLGLALVHRGLGAPADENLVWRGAQVGTTIASALTAVGAYAMSRRLAAGPGAERRSMAMWGLVVFSGVYFPYWVTTDTFTPFALAGGAALWLAAESARGGRHSTLAAAAAALLAGGAQWIRPDAPLLLVAPATALALRWPSWRFGRRVRAVAAVAFSFIAGLVPWVARNAATWGTPVPPGTGGAVWLTDYGDLFAFATPPSFDRWREAGLISAVGARIWALAENAAVLGQPLLYYLVPAAALGLRSVRRDAAQRPALVYVVTLYVTQSAFFPFQSVRGGLFHSLAAVLPFIALWTALGVERLVAAAARRRRWREGQAQTVFAAALVGFGALSSVYFLALQTSRWDARLAMYRAVASVLDDSDPGDYANGPRRVMAVDPPGFWYASGRDSVAIPSDGFGALLEAAREFDARYVVVESAGPPYLGPLWSGDRAVSGFTCVGGSAEALVYRVDPLLVVAPSLCPAARARAASAAPAP